MEPSDASDLMTKFCTSLQQMRKYILKRNTNLIARNIANLKLRNMRASQSRFSSQTEQTLSTVSRHLVAKFGTNASGAIWWPNLELMQVEPPLAGEITQVRDALPWGRCASGNV